MSDTTESITVEYETIGGERPWVAEITGKDAKYGLARKFVDGTRDYSRANSKRTRGVYTTYTLVPGRVYECSDPRSWSRTERYFARVVDGELETMDAEQVEQYKQSL